MMNTVRVASKERPGPAMAAAGDLSMSGGRRNRKRCNQSNRCLAGRQRCVHECSITRLKGKFAGMMTRFRR